MAQKTLNASAFSATQGWYSASGSTSGSGGTITMNFSTDLAAFRKQVDVNNITITRANLYVDCSKSGADRKKRFRLRMYKDSTLLHDFGTELYSTDYAYQANDVKISLAGGLSGVLSWIKTGTKITSVDPQTSLYFDLSGSATCSYNYVRLTGAHIVIDYTVNKSTLSNPPTTLTLGNIASFTISGSSGYTNKLTLTVGGQSQTLLSDKTTGTFTSSSLNLSLAKGISSTATSGKGTLTLTTYNGDASIGSNTYSVTVKTSSSCTPTATFSITTDPTYWLTGRSSPVFNVSGSSNYGATISSYKIYIGSQEYTATSGSNSIKISDNNPTGAQVVKLVVTDSRGYTKESSLSGTKYICKYSLPSLNVVNFFRSNSSGVRNDVDGTSCFVEYTTTYTNPIYNKSGTSVTPTISVCAIIGNSEVTLTNKKGIIPNTVFEKSKGYIIKFKITDKTTGFSYTTKDYSLQSSAFLLQFRKNQNSVGIGIVAQDLTNLKDSEGKPYSGLVSVGWDTVFSKPVTIPKLKLNNALQLTQGGTGVTSEDSFKKLIGNLMYPVGSIYMSTSSTNPSSLFGGTWVAWGAGRVPIGVGTGTDINSKTQTFSAGSTGGEYSHTLTTQEMPAHYHVPGREADKSNGSNTHFSTNVSLGVDEVARDTVGSGTQGGYVIRAKGSPEWLFDTRTTSTEGESQTHNNIQPYVTCYMWKRTA